MASKSISITTPLILSDFVGREVDGQTVKANYWLKMENCQPCGSFKLRGISHFCCMAKQRGCQAIVSSSGGNAGLAAAYSGRSLSLPTTVFVPGNASQNVVSTLKAYGAHVEIVGTCWDDANEAALKRVADDKSGQTAMIHPFDHPDIWRGHSVIVDEIIEQMGGRSLDCLVVSVGGGGLFCGIMEGLYRNGCVNTRVVAVETFGADCLNLSLRQGKAVKLDAITSRAKCLGAKSPCSKSIEWYEKHNETSITSKAAWSNQWSISHGNGKVISLVVHDKEAVDGCAKFLDDHRVLVEPACGAALAAVYYGLLVRLSGPESYLTELMRNGHLGRVGEDGSFNVAIIVCGGMSIDLATLLSLKQQVSL